MPDFVHARIAHLKFLLREAAWASLLVIVWSSSGLVLAFRDSPLPVSIKQQLSVPIICEISWGSWTAVLAGLVFLAIIEGSYRAHAELLGKIMGLESSFARRDEKRAIRDALSAFMLQGELGGGPRR